METGWANQVFPDNQLEEEVLNIAQRVAKIPSDLNAFNKRSVHRAMETMGMRNALRSGTDLQALSFHASSSRQFMKGFQGKGSHGEMFKILTPVDDDNIRAGVSDDFHSEDPDVEENDSSMESRL